MRHQPHSLPRFCTGGGGGQVSDAGPGDRPTHEGEQNMTGIQAAMVAVVVHCLSPSSGHQPCSGVSLIHVFLLVDVGGTLDMRQLPPEGSKRRSTLAAN